MTNGTSGDAKRIVVLGAGLSGLTAATQLELQGHSVTVVDKARGAGGRMSTRRDGDRRFDHGAQFFTARHPEFVQRIEEWRQQGIVNTWNGRLGIAKPGSGTVEAPAKQRFVGVPGMNSICKHLAATLQDCRFGWQVARIARGDTCTLYSSGGEPLECDAVIVTVPPAQARELINDEALAGQFQHVELLPCWAVMASFDAPPVSDFDALFVENSPLSWVAAQGSKPGRHDDHSWVLHANPDWSLQNIDDEPAAVCRQLLEAFAEISGTGNAHCQHSVAHRWRYAMASNPLDVAALLSSDGRLVAAGDWCHGSRVESAFCSGLEAARRIAAT